MLENHHNGPFDFCCFVGQVSVENDESTPNGLGVLFGFDLFLGTQEPLNLSITHGLYENGELDE